MNLYSSWDLVFPAVHCPGWDCAGEHPVHQYRDIPVPDEQRGRQPAPAGGPPLQAAGGRAPDRPLHILAGPDSHQWVRQIRKY